MNAPSAPSLCVCGCGRPVNPGRLYVRGHNARAAHPHAPAVWGAEHDATLLAAVREGLTPTEVARATGFVTSTVRAAERRLGVSLRRAVDPMSPADVEAIRVAAETEPTAEAIARRVGRDACTVRRAAREHGITLPAGRWSRREVGTLVWHAEGHTAEQIADMLPRRTLAAVRSKAQEMGIRLLPSLTYAELSRRCGLHAETLRGRARRLGIAARQNRTPRRGGVARALRPKEACRILRFYLEDPAASRLHLGTSARRLREALRDLEGMAS